MRKLLLQLDSSRLPSVFDRVVAYDGGADEVMSYGGIVEADARDLMHGCIFTRGPKDLKDTATFIGGAGKAGGGGAPPPARPGLFGPRPRPPAAVPPLGIEGVDVMDDGVTKDGVRCFGALAIGNLKMKLHKTCIARLFERNNLVLDAETIADVARELSAKPK